MFHKTNNKITSYKLQITCLIKRIIKLQVTNYKLQMFNFIPNWSEIPDNPYEILIIGVYGSGKANAPLNLLNHGPDINKIYSYAKEPYEAKHQFLINIREGTGLKYLNDLKAFIKYSNDMDDIYENIEEYNPNKKRKIFFFYDMIADMLSNKKRNPIVTELFIRGRKIENLTCLYYRILFCCSKKY